MDINHASLAALNTAYNTVFNTRLTGTETTYKRVAMTVKSTTKNQTYPKLSELGPMREWIGERHIERLEKDGFTIANRKFEKTISVSADEINDDQHGVYSSVIDDMALVSAELPDNMVWEQLEAGFTDEHYDGQLFFDTDHPVMDEGGVERSVSNFQGGSGAAWYLVDNSRAIMPIIFQDREPVKFTPRTNLNDDNVFFQDEFIWGSKRRCAAGFGAWQLIYASREELNAETYEAARVAMSIARGHKGRKLNLKPKLLVVPSTLEGAALDLLVSEKNAYGATNKWRNTASLHVETRLTLI